MTRQTPKIARAAATLALTALMSTALPGFSAAQDQPQTPAPDHDMSTMGGMDMSDEDMGGMMTSALGAYSLNRDASGTAWQPDVTVHEGLHVMSGPWMVMAHGLFNAVHDQQGGPRGDNKSFVSGMVMASAKRTFANGDGLQFRTMLSPDPVMGKSGYPLLLATGETADGKTLLVDRQHPHDLFMELSASYSHRLTLQDSVYLYGGLPGEPAFGPPTFMHRLSAMDSPEAPISHHWLDSTHITFGVVTAGYVRNNWKVELSQFHGREPDQRRYNIETGNLDSTAARLSWNPTPNLSLQTSWARQHSPEALEPDINPEKWSTSALYTRPFGNDGWWSVTGAFGRKTALGRSLDAYVLEAALKPDDAWTLFGRAERTENAELFAAEDHDGEDHHGEAYPVGKISVGAIHDWPLSDRVKLGVGALYSVNLLPDSLIATYGDRPTGTMAWLRLKIE